MLRLGVGLAYLIVTFGYFVWLATVTLKKCLFVAFYKSQNSDIEQLGTYNEQ